MKTTNASRRSFLKNTVALSAFSAIPGIVTNAAPIEKTAKPLLAKGRVNLACIGIGNRGAEIIEALHQTGLAT